MTSNPTKRFALLGAAGYIAPKHMKAIKDTGNDLVVACDRHDSVGIIDSYFPNASFFTEYERLDRYLEKQRYEPDGEAVDYISICTPNYLHDAHCRLALRVGADAICEKPLVINPWNLDQLCELEQRHGKKVYNVLQLRLHDSVVQLRQQASHSSRQKADICLTYITRRGKWYKHSWKGDPARSGQLPLNIGVHFFDFLSWVYGPMESSRLHLAQDDRWSGVLELAGARVKWFLSVNEKDLPQNVVAQQGYAYRRITNNGEEIDLSTGFTDLHTRVYEDILNGNGYSVEDAREAIRIVHQIRCSETETVNSDGHPLMLGCQSLGRAAG